jgi:hypothetical protein
VNRPQSYWIHTACIPFPNLSHEKQEVCGIINPAKLNVFCTGTFLKTVNWDQVCRDVLQLGKYGTSKKFFSLKKYLFGVRVFGILPICVSDSWILHHCKIYLQTTDLDKLYISTTLCILSIWYTYTTSSDIHHNYHIQSGFSPILFHSQIHVIPYFLM